MLKAEKKNKKYNDDEDIDAILNDFQQKQQELYEVTTEMDCAPPSRRANSSLCVNPLNPVELLLFGGEYYNGKNVQMYNDFYKYHTEKKEWRKIVSANSPQPRSSHQIAITPAGLLFLWGGEFVSPNETTFFHYKDFWMMDLKTCEWEKLEIRGRPPPRSGHRMAVWKHFLVIFGGFFDTNKDTKYYDDLWLFDTLEFKWINPEVPDPKPPTRSGFQLISNGDQVVVYGGYCKSFVKGQKAVGVVYTGNIQLILTYGF